jgi:hypothetical protein
MKMQVVKIETVYDHTTAYCHVCTAPIRNDVQFYKEWLRIPEGQAPNFAIT